MGREVNIERGLLTDYIDGFGSRVYRISLIQYNQLVSINENNLVSNPSFEITPNPGIPNAFRIEYVQPGGGVGPSTVFVDSRTYIDGSHSLRIVCASPKFPIEIRVFGIPVIIAPYQISFWAKSNIPDVSFIIQNTTLSAQLYWQYLTFTWIPKTNITQQLYITLAQPSTLWLDLFQVFPVVER